MKVRRSKNSQNIIKKRNNLSIYKANLTISENKEPIETIEKIILATIETVANYGYKGASTQKIANRAGVSKSLIHYHFKTKEDLLIHALNYFASEIAEEIKIKIQNLLPSIETAIVAAKEIYKSLITNKIRSAFFVEMYSNAIHNKKFRNKIQKYHNFEEDLIYDVIYKALYPIENKLIISLKELAKVFQTIMLGLSVQSVIELKEEDLKNRLDTLLKILTTVLINYK